MSTDLKGQKKRHKKKQRGERGEGEPPRRRRGCVQQAPSSVTVNAVMASVITNSISLTTWRNTQCKTTNANALYSPHYSMRPHSQRSKLDLLRSRRSNYPQRSPSLIFTLSQKQLPQYSTLPIHTPHQQHGFHHSNSSYPTPRYQLCV